jgi:type I restriction enzyme, S subunit
MNTRYPTGSLGDIADINPQQSSKKWRGRSIHYIDISSVGTGKFLSEPEKMLYDEAPSRARRVVKEGDILISTVRPNRKSIIRLESVSENTLVSTGFAVIRPKIPSDSHYIFSVCMSEDFTKKLSKLMNGAAYPSVSVEDILDVEIPIPELNIRRRIAKIAENMDYYISLLRQRATLIEGRISGIYQSLFVRFEPVKCNLIGEKSMYVGEKNAELFPSSFVDSEIGEIPTGWQVTKIGEIASERKENIDVNEMKPEMVYIGLEHMPRKSMSITDWGCAVELASGKRKFSTGEILFGKLRPNLHKVGFCPINGICSTDIIVINSIDENDRNLLLCIVSSGKFVKEMTSLSSGTRMPRVKWDDIKDYKIAIPDKQLRAYFQQKTDSYVELLQSNIFELMHIEEMRKTILHRLLIGKLTLSAN